ncbi:MAG TPA: HD domain-containing protein [bacterium]|nr:HD domain-containing protein [bacterium]
MRKQLEFLLETNKLKEISRTGWVLMKVKNPETIAEHIFRVCFDTWLLGRLKNFKVERLIKIALSHDLCEVYAGDKTPFFYWEDLKREKKEDEKILLKGVRLSQKEKERRSKIKFESERKSLLKLISLLDRVLKNEIFSCWLNYEKRISRIGKFVKQVDRIETLLQAVEYFKKEKTRGGTSWWELTEEIVEDPLLIDFLKVIQKKFYRKYSFLRVDKKLGNILDFLLKIGKLKRMPRLYWLANGIKKPETVAEHIFSVTLTTWILGREKKNLNMEKMLKMALCHELSAVYTGDTIPYIRKLPKDKRKRKEILKKWPRLPEKEKKKRFQKEYQEEKKALLKLTKKLDPFLRKEIVGLWEDYRKVKSPEALFLIQINTLAVLLQALLYQQKYKGYVADPLWEWAFEKCTDPIALNFLEALKERFY